jgi:hypothetical protein
MTYRTGGHVFSGAVLLAAIAAVAGCSTAADDPPLSAYDQAAIASGRGPVNTGSFPNLNIRPKAATVQFTPEESAAKLASLQAQRQRVAPAYVGETPEARRRRLKLLSDEQSDTLKVIENN